MTEFLYRARFRRDHRWAPGRMSAYLDDELASSRRLRLERHAHQCPECRRLLAGLRTMLRVLQALPPPAGGVDTHQLAASVRRRLSEPPGS